MPKKKTNRKKLIESYAHTDKARVNNPPVGLVTPDTDGWSKLARSLNAEIARDLIENYHGVTSLPFDPGEHKRIAVKIVDDRGVESLRVMSL